jgi:transposase
MCSGVEQGPLSGVIGAEEGPLIPMVSARLFWFSQAVEIGMLVVETVVRIRREFAAGKAIKAISRDLRLSRKVVRKAIRAEEGAFSYQRATQPFPKIGPVRERLEQLLAENEARPRRDRLRLTRVWDLLVQEGYDGSYDSVRRYAARWREMTKSAPGDGGMAFVPLLFQPGEAFQFDFSHEDVEIAGQPMRVKAAHVRLCASRAIYIRVYPRETQEMVFDAHARAFAFFGGVPTRGIYDNMKTAVDAVFAGKQRVFNRRFLLMADHYMFEPTACTPASGWEKGQVENQVQISRERFFKPRLKFSSLEELNGWLEDECRRWARLHPHPEQREITLAQALEADRRLPRGRACRLRHLPDHLRPQPLLGDGQGGQAHRAGARLCRQDHRALRRRGGRRTRPLLRPGTDDL